MLTSIGKPAQAVAQLQLALRRDPDAGSLYFLLLCRADYFRGARDGGDKAVGGVRLMRNAPTQMLTTSMAA